MANSADPDQLASEANWSGSTVCKGRVYLGSAGQELIYIMFEGRKQALVVFLTILPNNFNPGPAEPGYALPLQTM